MNLFIFFLLLLFVIWSVDVFSFFDYYLDRCGLNFSESFLFLDCVSILCLLMLFFCGLVALFFSGHYFSGSSDGCLLGYMLSVFLGVMGLLVSSYGLLSTLVFWEYLGVVSFFLILFYGNSDSLRATMVTVFASRFGDVCLFSLLFFVLALWSDNSSSLLLSVFLLFVILTKSACFPFISWLLEAMRAPTPVSSLVHSSTLVAAGVWFLFRYGNSFISFCPGLDLLFFVLSIMTVLITSFCSVVFMDLKKIVALSTCNNVSWCIIFFLLGDVYLGLFQLLGHGVAKCYLFIALGDLMSSSSSGQDSRGVYCSSYSGLLLVLVQGVLVFSLCGVPFLGVFFSKHGLLCDFLWSYSFLCYGLLYFGFFMSCVYSFRFLGLLCGFKSFGINFFGSLFILVFFLSGFSSFLSFLFVGGSDEIFLSGLLSSSLLLFVQLLGSLLGVWVYFYPLGRGLSLSGFFLWGCEGAVYIFYAIWDFCISLFLFLLFRWELGLLRFLSGFFCYCGGFWIIGWDSLKFLFIVGVCSLGLCLVLV